jgi:hypothetical protein
MYCYSHADELVEVVPEIVVVNELDEHFYLVCIVLEAGSAFVELLDDIADLPASLPYFKRLVRCIYFDSSRFFFLFSFLLSFRR